MGAYVSEFPPRIGAPRLLTQLVRGLADNVDAPRHRRALPRRSAQCGEEVRAGNLKRLVPLQHPFSEMPPELLAFVHVY